MSHFLVSNFEPKSSILKAPKTFIPKLHSHRIYFDLLSGPVWLILTYFQAQCGVGLIAKANGRKT
jgi:hypothetical protein